MMDSPIALHPCGQCRMHDASVWRPVTGGNVSILAASHSRRELAPGEMLFAEGAENAGVYCVSRGLMALRAHRVDGTSVMLRLAYPGDVIGFRSFLGDGVHHTEARALIPSRICTVTRRDAEKVVSATPDVLARLASRAVIELDHSQARIIASAGRVNKARLTALLTELMQRHGEIAADGLQMELPLSRTDLADLIGVQRETISRLIRRLEDEGSFKFSRRQVWMPQPKRECLAQHG
ncbi:MAG: Crp/Fnr family transcriptional regulator [Maritimibacter sp.]